MTVLVKDVFEIAKTLSLVVDEEEEITSIIKHYAEKPSLRGIFVVDKEQRLKGIITHSDLLQWAKYRIGADIEKPTHIDEINRYVYSTIAKDIIQEYSAEIYVKPEDSLSSALEMMLNKDLITLPVVDDQKKIVGDLILAEVLDAII